MMHLRVMQCESASESAPRNDSKQGTKIYDDEKSRQRISFFLSTLWGGSFAGGNVKTGSQGIFCARKMACEIGEMQER